MHRSQKLIKQEKDEITISLFVVPNYELLTFILGWGHRVKVVAPDSLRERIKEELKKTIELYK